MIRPTAYRGEPIVGESKQVCPLGRRAWAHAESEKGRQQTKGTLEEGSQFLLQVDFIIVDFLLSNPRNWEKTSIYILYTIYFPS